MLPEIMKLTSKPGYQVDITYEIKKEVNIPVFVNGRIITPDLAEEIISKDIKASFQEIIDKNIMQGNFNFIVSLC